MDGPSQTPKSATGSRFLTLLLAHVAEQPVDPPTVKALMMNADEAGLTDQDVGTAWQILAAVERITFTNREPITYSIAILLATRLGLVNESLIQDAARFAAIASATGLDGYAAATFDGLGHMLDRLVRDQNDPAQRSLATAVLVGLSNGIAITPGKQDVSGIARLLDLAGAPFGLITQAYALSLAKLESPAPSSGHFLQALWLAQRSRWKPSSRLAIAVALIERTAAREADVRFSVLSHMIEDVALSELDDGIRESLVGFITKQLPTIPARQALVLGEHLADMNAYVPDACQARLHLACARMAYRCNKLTTARDHVYQVLALFPESEAAPKDIRVELYNALGLVEFRDGHSEYAEQLLREAFNISAHDPNLAENATQVRANLDALLAIRGSSAEPFGRAASTTRTNMMDLLAESSRLHAAGDLTGAENTVRRVLENAEDDPTYDFERLRALTILASVSRSRRDHLDASAHELQAVTMLTDTLATLPAGTDHADRVRYYEQVESFTDRALLDALSAGDVPASHADELWQAVFRYREIESAWFEAVVQITRTEHAGSAQGQLLDEYFACCAGIGALELDGPGDLDRHEAGLGTSAAAFFDRLRPLYSRRSKLEAGLSGVVPLTRAARRRLAMSPEDVRRQLRADDVLLDIVKCSPASGPQCATLVGFVIRRNQPTRIVELGVSAAAKAAFGRDTYTVTDGVLDRLADVLRVELPPDRVGRLLVIPDGPFRELSIDSLALADGRCVADVTTVVYLGTAADLVGRTPSPTTGRPATVIGAPDFRPPSAILLDTRPYAPLPGAKAECHWIGQALGIAPITGKSVTETLVVTAASTRPGILHIASHGYYMGHIEWRSPDDNGGWLPLLTPSQSIVGRSLAMRVTDPLLATGIAVSGVNDWLAGAAPDAERGRGLVTARDIAWLDLRGTKVVVLSGCRTGSGTSSRYRGVVDLRSALGITGAEAAILALWDVPDLATAVLMRLLYDTAAGQQGQLSPEALRQAKIRIRDMTVSALGEHLSTFGGTLLQDDPYVDEVLRLPGGTRPFGEPRYWAGFVWYMLPGDRKPKGEADAVLR
ncbi:CHAT domain-containing protein [Micromonospora vulcania]|uniref:CHAT domain-containing protein n=1 Tax=Micromonospora vulcania TaxID=1441873 RepID=A0ABW1H2B1_9ACTN